MPSRVPPLFFEESPGFTERCELTGTSVQHSDTFGSTKIDHRDEAQVKEGLMMLWSENKELKSIVERVRSSHCPFDMYTLQSDLLNHLHLCSGK